MELIDQIKKIIPRSVPKNLLSPFQQRIISSRRAIRTLRARADAKRKPAEKLADWMTQEFGSFWFLTLNAVWFVIWIWINLGFTTVAPFDPFPFGLLTMIVSLEAIILSIFVLISQNREQRINDLREEIDLEVDLIAESEITKVMEIVVALAKKNGLDLSKDVEIKEMLKPLEKEKIERSLSEEIKV